MRIGTWTLTKRGETVLAYAATFVMLLVLGFVGWLENLGM
jgi:hypothetical protein